MYCLFLCWTFQCFSHFIFCEGTLFESFRPNDPTQFLTSFLWSITQIPAWRLSERRSMPAKLYVRQSQILVSSFPQCCLLLACGCLMLELFIWLPPYCWFGVGWPSTSLHHVCHTSVKTFGTSIRLRRARFITVFILFPYISTHALKGQFVTSSSVTIASCWAVLVDSQSQCCNSVGLFLDRRLPSLFAPKPVTTA